MLLLLSLPPAFFHPSHAESGVSVLTSTAPSLLSPPSRTLYFCCKPAKSFVVPFARCKVTAILLSNPLIHPAPPTARLFASGQATTQQLKQYKKSSLAPYCKTPSELGGRGFGRQQPIDWHSFVCIFTSFQYRSRIIAGQQPFPRHQLFGHTSTTNPLLLHVNNHPRRQSRSILRSF